MNWNETTKPKWMFNQDTQLALIKWATVSYIPVSLRTIIKINSKSNETDSIKKNIIELSVITHIFTSIAAMANDDILVSTCKSQMSYEKQRAQPTYTTRSVRLGSGLQLNAWTVCRLGRWEFQETLSNYNVFNGSNLWKVNLNLN